MLVCCRGERWADKLSITFRSYHGNQLKTDGYYFRESDGQDHFELKSIFPIQSSQSVIPTLMFASIEIKTGQTLCA